jgi:xanthine dehydrogenase molybdopterin-binding subunit B
LTKNKIKHNHKQAFYQLGGKKDGKVKAAKIKLFNNGGFTHDLSFPVLERGLFV